MITEILADMRRDLENGAWPEIVISQLLDMEARASGYDHYRIAAALREFTVEPTLPCQIDHGEQEIVDQGCNSGFAGGTIYWVILNCGCTDMDESDDVRAAY